LTLDYANSGSGTANITIQAEDTDGNTVTDTFVITITAGVCTNDPPIIGTKSSNPGAKDWNSVGDCTMIGDNYDIGNKWDVLDHVRIGDNFSAGGGNNGSTDIFAGAIIGDNVNAGTSTVAAGVIIPDGVTL
jgi:NDP-sugar pyrophosphorylase family protein